MAEARAERFVWRVNPFVAVEERDIPLDLDAELGVEACLRPLKAAIRNQSFEARIVGERSIKRRGVLDYMRRQNQDAVAGVRHGENR